MSRPITGYNLFMSEYFEQNADKGFVQVMRDGSKEWHQLTSEKKELYNKLARDSGFYGGDFKRKNIKIISTHNSDGHDEIVLVQNNVVIRSSYRDSIIVTSSTSNSESNMTHSHLDTKTSLIEKRGPPFSDTKHKSSFDRAQAWRNYLDKQLPIIQINPNVKSTERLAYIAKMWHKLSPIEQETWS